MRRRTTAAVAATTLLATGAVTLAAGRWASGAALGAASRSPRPAGFAGPRLTVHGVAAGRVTLTRSLDSQLPGTFAVASGTRHAVVGPVLDVASDPDTVVRRLERVNRGELLAGATVALTPQLHRGDPRTALGIPHADVEIPGDGGSLPAWFVPGERDTWVIALHGLGATREHPLNLVPFLHRRAFPVLLPGYRGDPGAPRPRSGVSMLGAAEWPDADAALRYAVRNGARRLVLYGWSTGGTMALYAAAHSPLRGRISGIVLDSPVLDPAATVRALAAHRGVPGPLVPLAVSAARARIGLDGGPPAHVDADPTAGPRATAARSDHALDGPPDHPTGPRGRPLPVLLVHGPDDTIAPYAASHALAARHAESVVLHTVPRAQHAAMWNADPRAYEEALGRFLTPLM
ncbi:alpha/beta fold hydrolase [Streptomyces sp. B6B3]|uniref:alpha/beta hydrolase n=1 Tax=Streptomyces sp. B6B3 TaxID=3153570 RepID=UPI00325C72F3